jgi:hypothetical protein
MKRSEIRGGVRKIPGYATLHPGYLLGASRGARRSADIAQREVNLLLRVGAR